MTANLVLSETTQAMLDEVKNMRVRMPVITWLDVTGRWTASHLYTDCHRMPKRRDGDTGDDTIRETAVSRPFDTTPTYACASCLDRRLMDRPLETASHDAVWRTGMLRQALAAITPADAGSIASAVTQLAKTAAAWQRVDQMVGTYDSTQLRQDPICVEATAARRQHDMLTNTLLAVFAEAAAQTKLAEFNEEHELRYYCATALSPGGSGPFAYFGVSAPTSGLRLRVTQLRANHDTSDAEDELTFAEAALAYRDFVRPLRDGEDSEQALTTARKTLLKYAPARTWTDEYLNGWAKQLAEVEEAQATAGNVQLILPPPTNENPWRNNDDLLLRWADTLEPDGTITVTAPAVLAGQLWSAYADEGNPCADPEGRDAPAEVVLAAADGANEQALQVIRKFFQPGSDCPLPMIINQAKLVTA